MKFQICLVRIYTPFCETGGIAHGLTETKIFLILLFTPLEIMPRCSAAGLDLRIIPAEFNAPLEFLTGFTFFIEFEKSIHGLLGKFTGIEVKVELDDRDLLNNVHL